MRCAWAAMWCWLPASASGQARAESGFPFEALRARAVALGGAGGAAAGWDFGALNPAAVAGERGAELSHRASPTGATDLAISIGHGNERGSVRLTFRRRDWGRIAGDLGLNDLTVGEQAVSLTVADQLGRGPLRWGLSVAKLDADYLGARTGTWGTDLGAQVHVGAGLRAGLALLHAGRGFPTQGERAPLPMRIRPSAAWTAGIGSLEMLAAVDVAMPPTLDAPSDLHAGVEIRSDVGTLTFAGRGGYSSLADRDGSGTRRGTVGLGAGVGIGPVAADFAFTFGTVLGDERFISLSFRW